MNQKRNKKSKKFFSYSLRDTISTVAVLCIATIVCFLIRSVDDSVIVIAMCYLLAVAIISRITTGYLYGIISCVIAVICDNYIFTYPYFNLNFSIPTYPVSFLSMFIVSLIICTMTSKLKDKDSLEIAARTEKMRSNLLLAISHDLRTPLTSIIGASSAIIENYDMLTKERRIELLKEVQEEAQWLIRMVENLLFITRINNEEAKVTKRPEVAEEIISEAVRKLKKRYPNAPIHTKIPDEILLVPMDATLIEQVIMNLLENAIRHSETATKILLTISTQEDYVNFEIRDNGVGIPSHILPHLFDGLVRTSKSTRVDTTKDMGIGLSVCMSIITAHNGTMEAHNNIEGGASFIFKLPLKENVYEQ